MFATEAELVATWLAQLAKANRNGKWLVYPETAGWDLLLVHEDGYQLGIEAKLSLNAKVLSQALSGSHSWWREDGPDYRAVLVPEGKCQLHMAELARALGIKVLVCRKPDPYVTYSLELPTQDHDYSSAAWPNWCPSERCKLPEYVPDVVAGVAGPVQLTPWKVKAIKLLIVLERRGYVTRADMRALKISPTRWCDHWHGFLTPGPGRQYLRGDRTPDLRAQHPTNWAQIEADIDSWVESAGITLTTE